ncbi:MAG: hypothetical protein K2J80_00630 [Oscillospiraceae bacterium]|nr:hypothetical protein [Oscillospiraceae bacterium]
MSPVLRIVLFIVFIGAAIDLIAVIRRLIPMMKRAREIKRIKNDPDVISVEAEIVEIHEDRINDMDTQYNVKLYYEVGYQKFYKNFILINKQSLRVGQTLMLLCDGSDPEKALIQNYSGLSGEEFGIKSTIFNLVIVILIMIADAAINAIQYIMGD